MNWSPVIDIAEPEEAPTSNSALAAISYGEIPPWISNEIVPESCP